MTPKPVVLYVEDDMLSREVMKVVLIRLMGYDEGLVHLFENSANFENRLDGLPVQPSIIFLDIHMEPLDGFAVLNLLRQKEAYKNTTVIALTASVMSEEIRKLKEAGFTGVIAKPLNADTFPETLRRIQRGEEIWTIR